MHKKTLHYHQWITIAATAIFLSPASLAAQATGTPTFFAPVRGFGQFETGISASGSGGGQVGLEGRYGFALDRADISLRAGIVDPSSTADPHIVAAIEARVPVLGHSRSFPLDGALILGVGHAFQSGGGTTMVPVGLSLGRRIVLDGRAFHITPYLQPTVVFGGASAGWGMGLGLDIYIRGLPSLRFNWGHIDVDGFAVSAFWGG